MSAPHILNVQSPVEALKQDLGPSLWEQLPAHHAYAINQFAQDNQQNVSLDTAYQQARSGLSVDDQEKQREQARLSEISAQIAQESASMDDSQWQKLQGQLEHELTTGQPQAPQQAPLQAPNLAQGIVGALGAIADPHHAFQYGAAPFQAQLQEQASQTQQNYDQYNVANQQHRERLQTLGALADNQAQHDARVQQASDRRVAILSQESGRLQQSLQRMDEKQRDRVIRLYSQYDAANTPSEKQIIADQIARLDPASAPSKELVQADKQHLQAVNEKAASQEWERALNDELRQFGAITPDRAASFEAQRQAIAKNYGVDPASLRDVPTTDTLAKQAATEKRREFDTKAKALAEDRKNRLAISQGRLDVARSQLNLAAQRFALAQQLGYGNMELARFRAQVQQYNLEAKASGGEVDGATADLDRKIAGAANALRNLKSGTPAYVQAQKHLNDLQGQRDYIASSKEPTIDLPVIGEVANPAYKGDQQSQGIPQVPGMKGPIGLGPSSSIKPSKKKAKGPLAPAKVTLPPGWGSK